MSGNLIVQIIKIGGIPTVRLFYEAYKISKLQVYFIFPTST